MAYSYIILFDNGLKSVLRGKERPKQLIMTRIACTIKNVMRMDIGRELGAYNYLLKTQFWNFR